VVCSLVLGLVLDVLFVVLVLLESKPQAKQILQRLLERESKPALSHEAVVASERLALFIDHA
jgi:hypothetical protein